jgi:hypothetical protein
MAKLKIKQLDKPDNNGIRSWVVWCGPGKDDYIGPITCEVHQEKGPDPKCGDARSGCQGEWRRTREHVFLSRDVDVGKL